MASKKTGNPVGRPTEYKPEFCQQLIDHMKQGNSFESFGAVVGKARQTLYDWTKAFPEFLDAKSVGLSFSLKFYEDMGKMIAMGQARRIKRSRPLLDPEGNVRYDADGKPLLDIEYEPANPGQSTWIFMMKNMHRWKDRVDMNVGGQEDAPPISFTDMTVDEIDKKMNEILQRVRDRK